MDRTAGHDPLPGCGGHNETGEDGGEGSFVECPAAEENKEEKSEAELTVDAYIDRMDLSSLTPRQRARFELEAEEQRRLTEEAKEAMASVSFAERVTTDEIMAHHTSFKVGGAAEAFIVARDMRDVRDVMTFATERNVPVTLLGNGTRTLVRDGSLRGIVLKLGDAFGSIDLQREEGDAVWASVGAAAKAGDLQAWAASKGFGFPEALLGYRGTVAGVFMVDPASLAEFVDELTMVEKSGREVTLTRKAITDGERIRFSRSSVITRMTLRLKKADGSENEERGESAFANERARLSGVFKNVGKQTADTIIADAGMNGIRVGRVRIDEGNANCFVNEGNARAKDAIILIGLVKDRVKQSQGIQLDTAIRIVGEE